MSKKYNLFPLINKFDSLNIIRNAEKPTRIEGHLPHCQTFDQWAKTINIIVTTVITLQQVILIGT